MITGISIQNFRGFRDMTLDGLARVNLLVGDNGSGKTALLEPVFLAMSNSPLAALQLRQVRGLDGIAARLGAAQPVAPQVLYDFLGEGANEARIATRGQPPFARSLRVGQDPGRPILLAPNGPPTAGADTTQQPVVLPQSNVLAVPMVFEWRDSDGNVGTSSAQIGPTGMTTGAAGVSYVATQFVSAGQDGQGGAATVFSALDRAGEAQPFIDEMKQQFRELEVIAVQLEGARPLLHGRLTGQKHQRPLEMLSGGITRLALILLTLAAPDFHVVLIDEIENGLHHSRFPLLWQQIRAFAARFDTQVFATTHSQECLDAAADAMAAEPEDFALLRTVRTADGCRVGLLPGLEARHLLRSGLEVRG